MPPRIPIPSEVVQKWQGIVDLLAEVIGVPAALIMKVEPPNIKVFVSSESKGNPYEPEEAAPLNTGLYCETVMKTSRPLLVPDALADEEWKSNPDIKLGMISYLGFPVNWPDGETFGTICILDNKRNEYSQLYKRLLLQFRDVLQADLSSLARLGGELTTHQEARREQADLLNLSHDAIYVRDRDDVIKYWNHGAAELYGWTAAEALGQVAPQLLKTVFSEPVEQIKAEMARTGRWEGELVQSKKDGNQVVVASRWSWQRDERGAPLATLITNNDITERKRAEQARQEIEEQWRTAFESNPTMYFIVDGAGTTLSVNPFAAEQLGYRVSELVGQPVLNIFYQPDREAVQSQIKDCFEHPGETKRWEARKVGKDGTVLWVRQTAKSAVLKKRPVLLVVCEDITDRKRAEEAARRSERALRDVIETIQAMVWSAPPDGSNTFVNRRWEEYTGLSAENTAITGWQTAAHPEDRDRHAHKVRRAFVAGESFTDEVRFRRAADGQYRWFLGRGVPLRDEQGNVVKCYGILTDIEDRKRAEALLAGEKRILEMVAKGDSLSQILDSLCRLVEEQASGVWASILLLDGNRLRHGGAPSLPKAYTEAIDGAAIGPCAGSCGTAAYRGAQVIVEDIATDPLWAEYRGLALPHSLRACWSTPVFSSQGKVIATFAMYYREPRSPSLGDQEIIEQITHLAGVAIERKLIQDELQRSESYRAEAERLGHTGSFAWDPNSNKVIYCSDEIFRIYGLEPQQALVNRQTFGRQTHPEDRAKVKASLEKSVREKVDSAIAYRIVLPDATVKHLQVTRHPVLDGAGNVIEVIGTMIDVTERKRAEEERERLRQLEADLVHINRVATMGELTASLAHEVNQPIAAAVTDASTCLRWLAGDLPNIEEAREAAKRTVKDAKRAAEIISRTRLLFKKSAPQCELIEVNEVINEMVALLRSEASRYDVAIRTELAPNLSRVPADRVQLQQVLMNLMVNGIEAMKGVDRRRELTLTSQPDGMERVRVSVGDTGVGLPAEGEEIFNAFFTTKPNGTGLGLAISRSITESHGGRLWAAKNSDHGAIFHLSLPTMV